MLPETPGVQQMESACVAANPGAHTADDFATPCIRAGSLPQIPMERPSEPIYCIGLVGRRGWGCAMVQKGLSRQQHRPAWWLRELTWLAYTTPLWAACHRVNLRPLVGNLSQGADRT